MRSDINKHKYSALRRDINESEATHRAGEEFRRVIHHIRLPLFAAMWAAMANGVKAQPVTIVGRGDVPGIRLTRLMTLHLPADAMALDFPNQVVRTPQGMHVLLDELGPVPVWLFDSAGKAIRGIPKREALIERSIVRGLAITPPDTLHVVSGGIAVFDRAGRPVRTRALPQEVTAFRALGTNTGEIVLQAIVRTNEHFGYPLHVIGSDGLLRGSFGAAANEAFDGNPSRVVGALASAGPDRFWSVEQRQYVIRLWTTSGKLLRTIERKASWFPPWTLWDGRMDVRRPAPRVQSLWQDRRGRLITVSAVPAATWKPVPGRTASSEAPAASAAEYARANDSVLEIIDPAGGNLLASQQLPLDLIGIVGDSLVAAYRLDRRERVVVDIWRFAIHSTRR